MSGDSLNAPAEFVDAHCHIDLLQDPAAEVERVETARIHTIAVTNAPSVFFHTRDLCRDQFFVHAALGLHPELVHSHGGEIKLFQEQVEQTRFVGEIGLDYVTTDNSLRQRQRDIFEKILESCDEAGGRILTIHSRRSAADVISVLSSRSLSTPILHWFSGTHRELDRAIEIGCYFSVNSSMLSSKAGRSLLSAMPPERVLTETDGPFVRINGKACTPTDVETVAYQLAAAWGRSPTDTTMTVQSNFKELIKAPPTRQF